MAMTEKNSAILRDRIHNLDIDNFPKHRESYENFRYKHFLLIFLILFSFLHICNAYDYEDCEESSYTEHKQCDIFDREDRNEKWTEECQNQRIESHVGSEETPAYPKYRDFYFQIKAAIANDDRVLFADLVRYPVYVAKSTSVYNTSKKENEEEIDDVERIFNKEDFLAKYDQIVIEHTKQVVKESEYRYLFSKDAGIMIGDGEIWLNGICTKGFDDTKSYSKCLGLEIKISGFNIKKVIRR